jgi:hypothetical protein
MSEQYRTRSLARRMRERLSYANVMSTIAVFGVLAGGSAYAAATIGADDIKRNAVRSKHIRVNAVSPAKLAPGAVSTAKLADEAVIGTKLADGAVDGSKLATGIPRDIELVSNQGVTNSANKSAQVPCPAGKVAIGGGAASPIGGATGFVALNLSRPQRSDSGPSPNIDGWFAQAIEVNGGSTQNWAIEVYAICARL